MASERERISRLTSRFADQRLLVGPGDDAAVVQTAGAFSVTSVDAVVDGHHFRRGRWPAQSIGRKAAAAALSDLAAMGAPAAEIYVAAGLPADVDEAEFDALIDGIVAAADDAGAQVAGGDLVAAEQLWLSVTVVGHVESPEQLLRRGGATAGDLLAVTGTLGGAARALELIDADADVEPELIAKQFAPRPQIAAGQALVAAGASAMIDVSDGAAHDAAQLAAASGLAVRIELERLPLHAGVDDPAAAAASGEEYELLVSIPPAAFPEAQQALAELGVRLSEIGSFGPGAGSELVDRTGARVEVRGFDHFD